MLNDVGYLLGIIYQSLSMPQLLDFLRKINKRAQEMRHRTVLLSRQIRLVLLSRQMGRESLVPASYRAVGRL